MHKFSWRLVIVIATLAASGARADAAATDFAGSPKVTLRLTSAEVSVR